MAYDRVTAFGTTRGNLTDEDRLIASQNSQERGIAAQQAALREQIAATAAGQDKGIAANRENLGLELADRGVGRGHQTALLDRGHGYNVEMDDRATKRAYDVADRAAAPQKVLADIEKAKWDSGAGMRDFQQRALRQAMGGAGGQDGGTLMGDAPGGGGAPGPMGGDSELVMYVAMGGNPGDLLRYRRQESSDKLSREDAMSAQDYETALKLMESQNPQARAIGAHILSKSKRPGAFTGQDPKMLENALVPAQAPGDAMKASPALTMAIDDIVKSLTKAGGSTGLYDAATGKSADASGATNEAMPKIAALVQQLVGKGVPEEEARAHIKQELASRLPQAGFISDPMLSLVDTFSPGTPGTDRSTRSQIRRGVGIVD